MRSGHRLLAVSAFIALSALACYGEASESPTLRPDQTSVDVHGLLVPIPEQGEQVTVRTEFEDGSHEVTRLRRDEAGVPQIKVETQSATQAAQAAGAPDICTDTRAGAPETRWDKPFDLYFSALNLPPGLTAAQVDAAMQRRVTQLKTGANECGLSFTAHLPVTYRGLSNIDLNQPAAATYPNLIGFYDARPGVIGAGLTRENALVGNTLQVVRSISRNTLSLNPDGGSYLVTPGRYHVGAFDGGSCSGTSLSMNLDAVLQGQLRTLLGAGQAHRTVGQGRNWTFTPPSNLAFAGASAACVDDAPKLGAGDLLELESLYGARARMPSQRGHRNAAGALSVVARTSAGAVQLLTENRTYDTQWDELPTFTSWQDLSGIVLTDPTIVRDASGRLNVFGVGTDSAIYVKTETQTPAFFGATPSFPSTWTRLGGSSRSEPIVVADRAGAITFFHRGTGDYVYSNTQTSTGWAGYRQVGTLTTAGNPAAVLQQDGNIALLARGANNALHYAAGSASTWSAWQSVGGAITSDPVPLLDKNGALVVFARGNAGQTQFTRLTPAGWTAWASMGGISVGPPAVGLDMYGNIKVFVRGMGNELHLKTLYTSSWTFGAEWPVYASSLASPPRVIPHDGDNGRRLMVFYRASDAKLRYLFERNLMGNNYDLANLYPSGWSQNLSAGGPNIDTF